MRESTMIVLLCALFLLGACAQRTDSFVEQADSGVDAIKNDIDMTQMEVDMTTNDMINDDMMQETTTTNADERMPAEAIATFAGGCFWCMEPPFEKLNGVTAVISGYAGGEKPNPTYKEVSSGKTNYIEAVQVYYDPSVVSYHTLLDVFWQQIDPTDTGGQFVDRGAQYTTAIFYHDNAQKETAEASKRFLEESDRFDKAIVTPIKPFTTFYPAEDYHQDYYKKSKIKYEYYRSLSGRDSFLDETWGDDTLNTSQQSDAATNDDTMSAKATATTYTRPSDDEIKEMLTPLQYKVTQEEGTEKPFDNPYWDNKEQGIYVDIVSGEPLFSSKDKYKSGTGWPSFTKPLESDNIVLREDRSWFTVRTEVRSKHGDSHLGHVFDDGPQPTGKRYCMNSAALRFIPKDKLEEEGYGQYLSLFE